MTIEEFLCDAKVIKTSFRKLINEIRSSTYATHGLYPYPAKFIPHVIRYVLKKYSNEDDWIFDPFAGYGSVAIECSLLKRNCIVWDLNPLLEIFVKASTYRDTLDINDFFIDFDYHAKFKPRYSKIRYFYHNSILNELMKAWGYFHNEVNDKLKPIVAIPLLRISRFLAYLDLHVIKPFRSQKAIERINELLKTDWRKKLIEKYNVFSVETLTKIREYQSLNPKDIECIVKAGVDSLREKLSIDVDLMLTSPPYLQAQEYIRSFKLELIWLGYSEMQIRLLKQKEIPYNAAPEINVKSDLYHKIRQKIIKLDNHKLLEIYESYFKSLAYFFENVSDNIRKYICIFVGRTKIRGMRIPIDLIIKEILENLGWKHEKTYIDTITRRRLFKVDINPATKLAEERTPTEHLVIMKKDI